MSALLATEASLTKVRPHIERLLRAALVAPVIEDQLVGDVGAQIDQLGNDLIVRARIRGESKRRLLTDDKLLTAPQVSTLLGSKSENSRQYANTRRKNGGVLAVQQANQFLYPAFQFDRARKRVYPEVPVINRLLDAANDAWGVLSWWRSPNARIRNRKPSELLGTPEAKHLHSLAESLVDPIG